MKTLIRGEKVKLMDTTPSLQLQVEIEVKSNFEIDITCFGLSANKKIIDDRYMIFYNQLQSPLHEIQLQDQSSGKGTFQIDLSMLPTSVQCLVFTATIDGNGTMGTISSGRLNIKTSGQTILTYSFNGSDFNNEKAIILTEVYFKDLWRVSSVGRGFDGGLAALLKHFGDEVTEEQTQTSPLPPITNPDIVPSPPTNNKKILLEKKMEKHAPKLLDLSKKAKISLEKVGLQNHTAKVALCLDISGSMSSLYRSGKIQ
ncbi:TerD family protein [Neobacillus cucumis]|uniref:TerD family protein n=1 Tax=Neobacillus cucumis TaxID=1740721 RepID=UPI002E1ECDEB|nr:TerD family protein [Neobacillus cucumis]